VKAQMLIVREKPPAMRSFVVEVLVVPSNLHIGLLGQTPYKEKRTITGYTLKDAKKRAGIE
jgi:hypothetical protein